MREERKVRATNYINISWRETRDKVKVTRKERKSKGERRYK